MTRKTIGSTLQFLGLAVAGFPFYIWLKMPVYPELQASLSYWWIFLLVAVGLAGVGTLIKRKQNV